MNKITFTEEKLEEIVRRVNDPRCTVAALKEWVDDVNKAFIDIQATIHAMAASGFFNTVSENER